MHGFAGLLLEQRRETAALIVYQIIRRHNNHNNHTPPRKQLSPRERIERGVTINSLMSSTPVFQIIHSASHIEPCYPHHDHDFHHWPSACWWPALSSTPVHATFTPRGIRLVYAIAHPVTVLVYYLGTQLTD